MTEAESNKKESGGSIKNKIIDVISKAEKEVDSDNKLFKGEEVSPKKLQKAVGKTDLSHRGRRDYDDDIYDDELDDDRDSIHDEKVIRKANDVIRKNM